MTYRAVCSANSFKYLFKIRSHTIILQFFKSEYNALFSNLYLLPEFHVFRKLKLKPKLHYLTIIIDTCNQRVPQFCTTRRHQSIVRSILRPPVPPKAKAVGLRCPWPQQEQEVGVGDHCSHCCCGCCFCCCFCRRCCCWSARCWRSMFRGFRCLTLSMIEWKKMNCTEKK